MNKCIILLILMLMTVVPVLTACSPDDAPISEIPINTPVSNSEKPDENQHLGTGNENNQQEENEMNRNITIRVGGHSFDATLEDNATAHAFSALLPMTVTMNEMNGNEKYYNLSENLPTDAYRPGIIQTGDLLLWGTNTLVLFYETFSSTYTYTRLGRINNPSGLTKVLGQGNVNVTFEHGNNRNNISNETN